MAGGMTGIVASRGNLAGETTDGPLYGAGGTHGQALNAGSDRVGGSFSNTGHI